MLGLYQMPGSYIDADLQSRRGVSELYGKGV
jgi:hypothetical protein